MDLEYLILNSSKVLALIGGIAFIVTIIIEVIKGTKLLERVPTQLVVIIVSILVCVIGYIAYASYSGMPITWYYIFAAFVSSFVVSYVSMYGFDTLNELYQRFKK